jgi:hypothetical protein
MTIQKSLDPELLLKIRNEFIEAEDDSKTLLALSQTYQVPLEELRGESLQNNWMMFRANHLANIRTMAIKLNRSKLIARKAAIDEAVFHSAETTLIKTNEAIDNLELDSNISAPEAIPLLEKAAKTLATVATSTNAILTATDDLILREELSPLLATDPQANSSNQNSPSKVPTMVAVRLPNGETVYEADPRLASEDNSNPDSDHNLVNLTELPTEVLRGLTKRKSTKKPNDE